MRVVRTFGLMILVVVAVYLCSYFALVQRGWGDASCGWVSYCPTYRFSGPWPCGLVGSFYEPAHRLDRGLLRKKVWAEEQDLIASIAAQLAQNGQLRPPNPSSPNQHLQATPR
jgi:hypothetical protein